MFFDLIFSWIFWVLDSKIDRYKMLIGVFVLMVHMFSTKTSFWSEGMFFCKQMICFLMDMVLSRILYGSIMSSD